MSKEKKKKKVRLFRSAREVFRAYLPECCRKLYRNGPRRDYE
jgi:hypothetical protein